MTDERTPTAAERASAEPPPRSLTPQDRVLLLDMWQRSGLTAREFGALVGVSKHTLFIWKKKFDRSGPAGLADAPRGAPPGSRLTEPTQRAILMLKQAHPEWGCDRIRDVLMRGEGYSASAGAIAHLLRENGYELDEVPTVPHEPAVQHFERARPNQLWQSDLFTFLLKRENRRVYLVVYLDDHSRFIVGYGVWASAGGALVREVLEAAIANFGAPEEVLTDNGPQYVTWRGTSAFAKLLERRGIRHLVARPRRPQTLGKTERFWGTLWRECVEAAIFASLDDARRRVGHFIDHYNFQRPHQGIEGLVPADRFFAAAPQVKETLVARVAANAHDLAVQGTPRKSFYLTGRVGDTDLALHSEGSRVVLTRSDGAREEVDLEAGGRRAGEDAVATMPEPVAPSAIESAAVATDDADPGGAA
jgi:transposase InsO family protein